MIVNPPLFNTMISTVLFDEFLEEGKAPLKVSAEFAVLNDVRFHSVKQVFLYPA